MLAAIVGRLGAAPLGAVGLSNLLFFFCQAFFGFLLIVTTPRVANAVAGGNMSEVRKVLLLLFQQESHRDLSHRII